VREGAAVATLFHIPGKPQPGVIVFSGSEGGLNEYVAAVLASHGFSTLALGYFNFEPCRPSCANSRSSISGKRLTGSQRMSALAQMAWA